MNVTCPICGEKCRVPEAALGCVVQCAACSRFFQCGSVSPPSLVTHPVPAGWTAALQTTPPVRAAKGQENDTIHCRCPGCKKALEAPIQTAGKKINCPDCGQRLQIPAAPSPVPVKTVTVSAPVSAPPPLSSPTRKKAKVVKSVSLPARSEKPENCLECGVDVTQRKRIQTCPDCGSLFCSARCYREHRYQSHSSRG